MTLKTLIVDDEPIARKVLREELDSIPDVEIVGEADDGPTALQNIAAHQPDLVLLDLQMPAMGGLDVMRNLKGERRAPVVVMVTAYDNYALQAFDAGAVDYLLKPVSRQRLTEAIERARRVTGSEALQRLAQLEEVAEKLAGGQRTTKIVGRAGEEYFLLGTNEIYAFQADGDTVWILTARQKYKAGQTLKVLEKRLYGYGFRRVHRNAVLNVDHVRKMSALSSQRWLITLGNGQEFVASKRQARAVRELVR
ncbi:MAG TPA: LytTR family DNA-binding domain-containing protein [Bryobacteraceae bacterium]|nr:LytTR family DNA-binding domain-containing protein [Bryobacteraceae bacterium]